MTKGIYIGLALFLSLASARAQEMAWERLPDLTVPRVGHALLQLDGELTVIGGTPPVSFPPPRQNISRTASGTRFPPYTPTTTAFASG